MPDGNWVLGPIDGPWHRSATCRARDGLECRAGCRRSADRNRLPPRGAAERAVSLDAAGSRGMRRRRRLARSSASASAIAPTVIRPDGGLDAAAAAAPTADGHAEAPRSQARGQEEEGGQAQGADQGAAARRARRRSPIVRAAGLHDAQAERLRPEGDVAGADRAPGRRRRRRLPRVLLHQGQLPRQRRAEPEHKLTRRQDRAR